MFFTLEYKKADGGDIMKKYVEIYEKTFFLLILSFLNGIIDALL